MWLMRRCESGRGREGRGLGRVVSSIQLMWFDIVASVGSHKRFAAYDERFEVNDCKHPCIRWCVRLGMADWVEELARLNVLSRFRIVILFSSHLDAVENVVS